MKRRAHYIRLYRRLDLPESATLNDLKYNYHLLATHYHPDKTTQIEVQSVDVELFKDIQAAYRELKRYNNEHGYLPLSVTQNAVYHPGEPEVIEKAGTKRPSVFPSLILAGLGILFIFILIYPFTPGQNGQSDNTDHTYSMDELSRIEAGTQDITHNSSPAPRNPQKRPLQMGMKMGKVFELLGVPDTTVGSNWYYGNSEIYFRDGHVAGWVITADSPIIIDKNQPLVQYPPPARR